MNHMSTWDSTNENRIHWQSHTRALLLSVLAAITFTILTSCSDNPSRGNAELNNLTQNHSGLRTLAVTGVGEIEIAPDHAILSVSTSCVAKTSSAARDECAVAMTAIFNELAQKEVPQENIKTTNFRISEKTIWKDGRSERIGFEVSNSLSVRLDDFGIISELLDRLVTVAGDTIRINGFRYGADRQNEHALTAYTRAIEHAKAKAKSLSLSSAVSLGDILSINTGGQTATPILRTGVAMLEAADMGSAETPLTPGVQTISKTVVIVWEIE
ncbi:MAG: hypothetical protein CL771_02230 [Chloroflexi bacterium]|nr:hypothetical protein [Chloroflexota bacterium]|tara:strand:+ start:78 stop:890 length:813 start_codon:yes stop_codon:yes gene_type:complete